MDRVNLPRLTTCCGCITLETGSKIIGWLQLISSAIAACVFGVTSLFLGLIIVQDSEFKDHIPEETVLIVVNLIVYLIIIAEFYMSVCLLTGIHKQLTSRIDQWLIGSVVLQAFIFFLGIVGLFLPVPLLSPWGMIAPFGVKLYYIWVVNSYKMSLTTPPSDFRNFKMDAEI